MQIKICGITDIKEAAWLNEAGVDYAGFVFYEKSRRNITPQAAAEIFTQLHESVKKVAVLVSPTADRIREIQKIGFDILQIHKELTPEALAAAGLPVWYALNISDVGELEQRQDYIRSLPSDLALKIKAIVVDAPQFGSGKTFDWQQKADSPDMTAALRQKEIFLDRKFVLAGGLNAENVAEGIRIFKPDIVDVSSSVEGDKGKDRTKIMEFTDAVRSI